jgi:hypothetical protein
VALVPVQKPDFNGILDWYQFQLEALSNEEQRVVLSRIGLVPLDTWVPTLPPLNPRFEFQPREQIREYFEWHREELRLLTMLSLLAAIEAFLRIEFSQRINMRVKRDPVRRRFAKTWKSRGETHRRIRLKEDILTVWCEEAPHVVRQVRDYEAALQLRHWLAHGRYWTPKIPGNYSPNDIYDIALALVAALAL